MKAAFIRNHGGPSVIQYGDLPEPEAGPGEALVRVRASALNRLDLYTRAGLRGTKVAPEELPRILGGDCAGEVAALGEDVDGLSVGQRVVVNPLCGSDPPQMLGTNRQGSNAEYVAVPAQNVIPRPESVTYEQAASLPTVFMPCWSIIIRKGRLKPWETALILSASSGVGTAAIQVAKNVVGARVITTTSTDEKAAKAKALGADEVINYSREDIAQRVKELTDGRGADLVLDHVGADFWPAAVASLARGGRYGICGVTSGYKVELQMGMMFLKHQTVFGVFMGRTEDLRQIVQLAGRGTIRGIIDQTFPLENATRAHQAMESRNFFGKIILTVP